MQCFLSLIHHENLVAEKQAELEANRRDMTQKLLEQNEQYRQNRQQALGKAVEQATVVLVNEDGTES